MHTYPWPPWQQVLTAQANHLTASVMQNGPFRSAKWAVLQFIDIQIVITYDTNHADNLWLACQRATHTVMYGGISSASDKRYILAEPVAYGWYAQQHALK